MTAEDLGLIAAIATAAATVTSAVLTALWRWLDRQEAEWGVLQSGSSWVVNDPYGNETPPHAWAFFANLGEGAAYRVSFNGAACKVDAKSLDESRYRGWQPTTFPVLRTGEHVRVTVWCDAERWADATVAVSWSVPPTRKRRRWLGLRSARRTQRFRLVDIAEAPRMIDGGDRTRDPL